MEITVNKETRLRNAILKGSSKKLQDYFKKKDNIENELISCYENSYKFMNFDLVIEIEDIKDIYSKIKNLVETIGFIAEDNIPLAIVDNPVNRTSVCLNYFFKENSYNLEFKNKELGTKENIELDKDFMQNFIKNVTQGRLTGYLKNCLYKYNVENKREF